MRGVFGWARGRASIIADLLPDRADPMSASGYLLDWRLVHCISQCVLRQAGGLVCQ